MSLRLSSFHLFMVLLAAIAACLVGWLVAHDNYEFLNAWLPSLGTALLAIAVGVFLVERLLERERVTRRHALFTIAGASLVRALLPITTLGIRSVMQFGPRGIDASAPGPLRDMFEQWAEVIRRHEWRGSDVNQIVGEIFRLRDSWDGIRNRFEASDHHVPLVAALDEYVAWVDFNRDLFTGKAATIEALGGFHNIDESTYFAYGDPRASFADLVADALEKIAGVLSELPKLALAEPRVSKEAIDGAILLSPGANAMNMNEQPPRELPS